MSDTERENFKAEILDEFIKKWKPVVIAFFSAVGVAITTTWWVAHNIATTGDVQKVSSAQVVTNQKIDELKDSFNNHVQTGNITKVHLQTGIDSLAKITYKIEKKIYVGFVTERYLNGRNHKPTLTNVE